MCSTLKASTLDVFERYPELLYRCDDWGPMLFASDKIQDNRIKAVKHGDSST
ncbi:hypothetical protein O9993_03360 [Vibrio lentus]|nr:hypothetical protein [Vibrio lentus]